MLIADAQVHIWGPNTLERPWKEGTVKPHREVPLGADELLGEMDRSGVYRAILVPPAWDGDRNDLCLEAGRKHPQRFGVMGRLNLTDPRARGRVAGWREQRGMFGLRCSFNREHLMRMLADGKVDWLFEEADKARLPLMLLVKHSLLGIVDRVAERHPDLKLALCHLSLESGKYDAEAFAEFDKLLAVARHPNVSVKVSALPAYTRDTYPYRALHPYLRQVYDAFGPDRMFWGTDIARLPCTYRQAVTMFTEEIPWLTNDDKMWIMGKALCQWLDWK